MPISFRKTASSHDQVANESDQEYLIVAIFQTIVDPTEGQPDKQEVSQGIDYLSRVDSGIVILGPVRVME